MQKNLANKYILIISLFALCFIMFAGIYVEILIDKHLKPTQDTTIIISNKDTIKPINNK
jgi:hypothetical protein